MTSKVYNCSDCLCSRCINNKCDHCQECNKGLIGGCDKYMPPELEGVVKVENTM